MFIFRRKTSKTILLSAWMLCLLLFMLLSCTGESKEDEKPTANPGADTGNTDTANDETDTVDINGTVNVADERLYADVPDMDFGGYEFKILTYAEAGNAIHDHPDLTWSEEDFGDRMNDAVYARNTAIEERFNITLKEIHSQKSADDLAKSIRSQEDSYDLVGQRMAISYAPIANGYYMNLHSLPNLDLTKPWYIQSSVENLTVKGKLFTVFSEMLISPYCAATSIAFNKRMHGDYGMPDLYQMVKEGRWTMDAMCEMARTGSEDLNSDGEMTFLDDRWGFVTNHDSMAGFLIGGGGSMSVTRPDGSFEFTLAGDKNISILDRAFELLYDKNVSIDMNSTRHGQSSLNAAMDKIWGEERALFAYARIVNIRYWRDMDVDFGLVPVPKYDENQDYYRTTVSPWIAMGIGIPATAGDIERTTIITEALSAESRYTVQPAYFEVNLKMKQARDDESAEMLDIVFNTTVIDPAIMYNFGGMFDAFQALISTRDRNIQSLCEKSLPVAEKAVNEFLDFIGKLD